MVTYNQAYKKSVKLFRSSIGHAKTEYARHKQNQSAKRLERARIVKAIRSSNLSDTTQRRELAKLHQSRFSKFVGRFKKQPKRSTAYFGTESEG